MISEHVIMNKSYFNLYKTFVLSPNKISGGGTVGPASGRPVCLGGFIYPHL